MVAREANDRNLGSIAQELCSRENQCCVQLASSVSLFCPVHFLVHSHPGSPPHSTLQTWPTFGSQRNPQIQSSHSADEASQHPNQSCTTKALCLSPTSTMRVTGDFSLCSSAMLGNNLLCDDRKHLQLHNYLVNFKDNFFLNNGSSPSLIEKRIGVHGG